MHGETFGFHDLDLIISPRSHDVGHGCAVSKRRRCPDESAIDKSSRATSLSRAERDLVLAGVAGRRRWFQTFQFPWLAMELSLLIIVIPLSSYLPVTPFLSLCSFRLLLELRVYPSTRHRRLRLHDNVPNNINSVKVQ